MIGAIIGDVVGSIYEELEYTNDGKRKYVDRIKVMDSNTELFTDKCIVTDDSALTIAVADAILNNKDYSDTLREYGNREIEEGRNRFGSGFLKWLKGEGDCTSIGNGCAMRISPIGYLYNDINKIKEESRKLTITSHNNEDCVKCAEAVAVSIYLLKNKTSKEDLKKYIEDNYFSLDYDLEDLRNNYTFEVSAIKSVPQAIYCFLESNNFEDSIRKSLSIGGDSDTIACIACSLAEAYYGVPDEFIDKVKKYLLDYMVPILNQVYGGFYERDNRKVKRTK